jgi:hypothetical protein
MRVFMIQYCSQSSIDESDLGHSEIRMYNPLFSTNRKRGQVRFRVESDRAFDVR